jgi:hypothetical protein
MRADARHNAIGLETSGNVGCLPSVRIPDVSRKTMGVRHDLARHRAVFGGGDSSECLGGVVGPHESGGTVAYSYCGQEGNR